jgi:hypothetical protein
VDRTVHHVQLVLTPLQMDLRARSALPGPMLVRLDRLNVQNVLTDRHQQVVHHRAMLAHLVHQGHTTPQADLLARSAWPGHTPQPLECLSVYIVSHTQHQDLEHRTAVVVQLGNILLMIIHALHAWPGHTLISGHTLIFILRLIARNVLTERHQQPVHRRAHPLRPVLKGTTTL